MRWIVGLDLRGRSTGAVALARWLYQNTERDRFFAVHALELTPLYSGLVSDELAADALRRLNQVLEQSESQSAFTDVAVTSCESAVSGLERAISEHDAEGMIIGRRAPSGQPRVVALGRVARRIVRHVAKPTMIVPPDLTSAWLEQGPILVATDLGPSSVPALQFAKSLGRELGRELVLVHAIRISGSLETIVSGSVWDSAQLEHRNRAAGELKAWAAEHGMSEAKSQLLQGPISREILAAATRVDACMIVCGSRRLSIAERIFTSSGRSRSGERRSVPIITTPRSLCSIWASCSSISTDMTRPRSTSSPRAKSTREPRDPSRSKARS